jgi:hypothetical protein
VRLQTDDEFAGFLLDAVLEAQNERPRDRQQTIGPSGLGACRERIRATMVGDPGVDPVGWKLAAWVGTVGGDALEALFAERLGAIVQKPVLTVLPRTKLKVAGHTDAVFADKNVVTDLKSKDGFENLDRATETDIFENLVQISVYTLGLIQDGTLRPGASARLVYWDRSGNTPHFVVIPITHEGVMRYVDIAEQRLLEVIAAQDRLEAGDLEARHALRDKSPSYCFSQKVQCPFRYACWEGSEWMPDGKIEHQDDLANVAAYIEARQGKTDNEAVQKKLRDKLRGVQGTTPDGWVVSWTGLKEDGSGGRLDVRKV